MLYTWASSAEAKSGSSYVKHTAGCLKRIARVGSTQNRFSGYIYLMCRVLVQIYLLTFFDSRRFTLLIKPILLVFSEITKRKQPIHIVLMLQYFKMLQFLRFLMF